MVKGQETQLSLEQEVKIAEHSLLLSTLKPRIAFLPCSWRTRVLKHQGTDKWLLCFKKIKKMRDFFYYYPGYILKIQLPSPFSQIPVA